jgi:hypothetical protein
LSASARVRPPSSSPSTGTPLAFADIRAPMRSLAVHRAILAGDTGDVEAFSPSRRPVAAWAREAPFGAWSLVAAAAFLSARSVLSARRRSHTETTTEKVQVVQVPCRLDDHVHQEPGRVRGAGPKDPSGREL